MSVCLGQKLNVVYFLISIFIFFLRQKEVVYYQIPQRIANERANNVPGHQ